MGFENPNPNPNLEKYMMMMMELHGFWVQLQYFDSRCDTCRFSELHNHTLESG